MLEAWISSSRSSSSSSKRSSSATPVWFEVFGLAPSPREDSSPSDDGGASGKEISSSSSRAGEVPGAGGDVDSAILIPMLLFAEQDVFEGSGVPTTKSKRQSVHRSEVREIGVEVWTRYAAHAFSPTNGNRGIKCLGNIFRGGTAPSRHSTDSITDQSMSSGALRSDGSQVLLLTGDVDPRFTAKIDS